MTRTNIYNKIYWSTIYCMHGDTAGLIAMYKSRSRYTLLKCTVSTRCTQGKQFPLYYQEKMPSTQKQHYIRKTSKGLKRAFCPLKPLKLCFKAIKSFKIFKTRISLKFFLKFLWKLLHLAPFFCFKKIKRDQALWCFADAIE